MKARIGLAAVAAAGLILAGCGKIGARRAADDAGRSATGPPEAQLPPSNRLVYPWSVVAGGLQSPVAMRQAMAEDPLVRAHYAGLNPDTFRAATLPEKRQGYVSYRVGDKIFWTRRMVTLQAGETVLTDSNTLVRGRCGNLFSATPREPVAAETLEPPEIAMDAPVREAQLMESPKYPKDPALATDKIASPKELAASPRETSALAVPKTGDAMPPAWVAGGTTPPGNLIAGVPDSGGTPAATTGGATTPAGRTVPAPTNPLEKPPPMVLTPLEVPSNEPKGPPTYDHPPTGNPPPYLPPHYPPTTPQSAVPPPAGHPPPGPPPSDPPTGGPPPGNPPGDPPPGDPPYQPPPADPPPYHPPFHPPNDPPDSPIPEPGAWVLLAIGIGAIAAGSWGRKS